MTVFLESLEENVDDLEQVIKKSLRKALSEVETKNEGDEVIKASFKGDLTQISAEVKSQMVKEAVYKQVLLYFSQELVSHKNNLTAEQFKKGFDAIVDEYARLAKEGEQVEVFEGKNLSTENADEIALIKRLQSLTSEELRKENPHNWVCSPILKSILLAPVQHMGEGSAELRGYLKSKVIDTQASNEPIIKDEEADVIHLSSNYYFIDKKNQPKGKSDFELARTAQQFDSITGEISNKTVDFSKKMQIALLAVQTQEDFLNFSKELVRNRRKLSPEEFKDAFFVMLEAYEGKNISEKDKEFINELKKLKEDSLGSSKVVDHFYRNWLKCSDELRRLITAPLRHMATESSGFTATATNLCSLAKKPEISAENDEYIVIRVPGKNAEDRYYIADKKTPLGAGGQGILLTAQAINPITGEIIKGVPPYAVKCFTKGSTSEEQEEIRQEIDRQNYFPVTEVQSEEKIFLFTELLRETDLKNFLATEACKRLSPEQRLDLILQIVFSLNVISHETPSTKEALIHRDIKPANIMVFFDKTGSIHAQIIDFGLSVVAPEDPSQQMKVRYGSGTIGYAPPERWYKKAGLKSDTFSMAVVIAEIFGVKDAGKLRQETVKDGGTDLEIRLDLIKMVPLGPEDYWLVLDAKIKDFVANRMDVKDYASRADNDEVMRFFIEARKFAALAPEYMKINSVERQNPSETTKELLTALNVCLQKMLIVRMGVAEFPFSLFDDPVIGTALIERLSAFVAIDENLKERSTLPTKEEKENLFVFLTAVSRLARLDIKVFDEKLVEKLNDMDFCKTLCSLLTEKQPPELSVDKLIKLSEEFRNQKYFSEEITAKIFQKAFQIQETALLLKNSDVADANQLLKIFVEKKAIVKEEPELFNNKLVGKALLEKIEGLNKQKNAPLSDGDKKALQPFLMAILRYAHAEQRLNISLLDESLVNNLKTNENFCKVIPSLSVNLLILATGTKKLKAKGSVGVDELVRLSKELYENRDNIPKDLSNKILKKIVKAYIEYKAELVKANPNGHERWFFGHDNQTKLHAAEELLSLLKNPNKKLSDANMVAANEGRLGQIVTPFMTTGPGKN